MDSQKIIKGGRHTAHVISWIIGNKGLLIDRQYADWSRTWYNIEIGLLLSEIVNYGYFFVRNKTNNFLGKSGDIIKLVFK